MKLCQKNKKENKIRNLKKKILIIKKNQNNRNKFQSKMKSIKKINKYNKKKNVLKLM